MAIISPVRPPTPPVEKEEIPPTSGGGGGDGGRSPIKLITAIVPPHRLDAVHEVAVAHGAPGLTVTDVQGFGRQRGHIATYRGAEYSVEFIPKVQVEMLVHEGQVKGFVDALVGAVRTGEIGDGKVWVTTVESVTRIRTGEAGPDAL